MTEAPIDALQEGVLRVIGAIDEAAAEMSASPPEASLPFTTSVAEARPA